MSARRYLRAGSRIASEYFVVWVLLFSGVALVVPGAFTWIAPYIAPLLGVIMLGRGLTLRPDDFRRLHVTFVDLFASIVQIVFARSFSASRSATRSIAARRKPRRSASTCFPPSASSPPSPSSPPSSG